MDVYLDCMTLICSDLQMSGLRIFPQRKTLFIVQLDHLANVSFRVAGKSWKFEDGINVNETSMSGTNPINGVTTCKKLLK